MSLDDEFRCSGLEAHAALDADDGVAHVGVAADGVGGTNLLNLLDGFNFIVEVLTVDADYLTLLELNLQQGFGFLGGDVLQVSVLGQALRGVEQLAAANAGAPDAYVIRIFQFGEVCIKTVLVEEIHLFLACQLLVTRQGDDFYAGSHHEERHVEANLVVAGACRAVGDGIGANLLGIAGDGNGLEDAL